MPLRSAARVAPPSCAALLLLLAAAPVDAIDIAVDVLGDPVPNGCTPGDCSLREAVTLANSLAGRDRVLLPATPGLPLQLSIPGADEDANATGDLDVTDDLEIIGAGADATLLVQTAADRVLHTVLAPDRHLVLRGLTIQGGRARFGGGLNASSLVVIEDAAFVGNEALDEGGAISYTAPFDESITQARLVLRRVRFADNTAADGVNFATGGALQANSNILGDGPFLLVEDCRFDGNEGYSGGGGIYVSGGVNWSGGTVIVRRSQFNGNRAGNVGGAAIMVDYSSFPVRIEDSLFDANVTTSAVTYAGGAFTIFRAESAEVVRTTFSSNQGPLGAALGVTSSLRLIDSQLFDNVATRGGGAVWGTSDLLVDRSTFESNRVTSTDAGDPGGGAIAYRGFSQIMGIQRSTFSGNDAFRGGAISLVDGRMQLYGSTVVAPGAGIPGRAATALRILDDDNANPVAIANTLISGSCSFPSAGRRLAVAYNNIESPGMGCRFAGATATSENQTGVTAQQLVLGRLADNGGPTLTHLPGAGSLAIDGGRSTHCTSTDQRHFPITDRGCDVGAVEAGAAPAPDAIFGSGFET